MDASGDAVMRVGVEPAASSSVVVPHPRRETLSSESAALPYSGRGPDVERTKGQTYAGQGPSTSTTSYAGLGPTTPITPYIYCLRALRGPRGRRLPWVKVRLQWLSCSRRRA
jgi:hypothetical protein